MDFPSHPHDWADHGILLMPSSAFDFDGEAHAILDGQADTILGLKPFLVIVTNRSPRTVIAYTVTWTITRRNESTEVYHTQFKFPDAVAGTGAGLNLLRGREIRPGEQRLLGMGFEAWPVEHLDACRLFGESEKERFALARDVRVDLDAVIFDDGTMIGPDQSRLCDHFSAFLEAKQELYREVLMGLEAGRLTDDVLAPLRRLISVQPHHPTTLPPDPVDQYLRIAASEIVFWHNRIAGEVFRRAMRREPFVISRRG